MKASPCMLYPYAGLYCLRAMWPDLHIVPLIPFWSSVRTLPLQSRCHDDTSHTFQFDLCGRYGIYSQQDNGYKKKGVLDCL